MGLSPNNSIAFTGALAKVGKTFGFSGVTETLGEFRY
jgi:hypothetical protein